MICYGYGMVLRPSCISTATEPWQTIDSFRTLASGIEQVYLVEASPSLRETQRKLLCGDAPFEQVEIGFRSTSKYSNLPITWCEDIRFVPNGKPPVTAPSFSWNSVPLTTSSPHRSHKNPVHFCSRVLRRASHPRLPIRYSFALDHHYPDGSPARETKPAMA